MIYPYIVKANGVYYEAGENVPALKPLKEPTKIEKPIEKPVEKPIEKNAEEVKYTKTDINRMSKAELVEQATKIGIEDAEDLSGNVLKDKLIEHYNL